ncbi:MAG: hypothetical protein KDA28_12340, partial [Phycisphaerales bacterium]|nr:hypothetical protein [Phycisphaerales bacterium]
MKRLTIVIYIVCVVLVLDALAWVTWHTVNLERRERDATRSATSANELALALWPLDEQANTIIRREASRPYFQFSAFYPAGRPYSEMWRPVGPEDRVVASPLFTEAAEFVKLHFEVAGGVVTSPQVPARERWVEIAQTLWDLIRERESLLYELEPLVADLSPPPSDWMPREGISQSFQQDYDIRAQSAERSRLVETVEPRVEVGAMVPFWVENPSDGTPELILVRRVSINKEERLQGVWLDWPTLEQSLLASIVELFPLAVLRPVTTDAPPDAAMLASIPAMLVPGDRPIASSPMLSPARRSLLVTWAAVIAAIGAIGIVLRASMSLSERRGRFVSAVTHELRTPMTTFCLYSQMLADGMVRDESTRDEYLQTLKRESERLAEIVENVLAYARLTQKS